MADFPKANKAYSAFFGSSPPSRACVAVILPPNQRVRLEAMGYDDTQLPERSGLGRSALHVQSISYWAPANIGPYSQAVMVSFTHSSYRPMTKGYRHRSGIVSQ